MYQQLIRKARDQLWRFGNRSICSTLHKVNKPPLALRSLTQSLMTSRSLSTSVDNIRNLAIYGDINPKRFKAMILTEGSTKETIGGHKSYVYSTWNKFHINLVELPVEEGNSLHRALRVIDGAILVLCAISSVCHEDVDMHMRKNGVARLIYIENMERAGADPWRVILEVRTKLKLRCASLHIPIGLGPTFQGFIDIVESKAYYFHKFGSSEVPKHLQNLVSGKKRELIKLLSKVDPRCMVHSPSVLKETIRRATVARQFVPAFVGVALECKSLLDGILEYLPCPLEVNVTAVDHDKYEKKVMLSGNPEESLVGLVFSSEDCLEKEHSPMFSYIRLFQGLVKKGSRILNVSTDEMFVINVLFRVSWDGLKEVECALAGDIVATSGVYFEPGDTITDGTVDYSIPCARGLSLRPMEVGAFHKMFSLVLGESSCCIRTAESLHCVSIKTGLEMAMRHNLISAYCQYRELEGVIEVLKFTDDFNRKLLNTLIHAFAKAYPEYSLVCFRKLLHVGPPTNVSFRGLIRAYRRVDLTAERRLELANKNIIKYMKTHKVLVERRHKVALVDMILGGGLIDEAHKKMKEDKLHLDEKIITSFLHAYTATKDYTVPKETDPVKMKEKRDENVAQCQIFVAELEEQGIHYTINQSLRKRLQAAEIKLGLNVLSEPEYRFVCGRETDEEVPDC